MLFERRCAGCGRVGWVICQSCIAGLQPAPLDARPPTITNCIDSFVAATAYDPLAARLILAAKNGGRRDVLRALAAPLIGAIEAADVGAVAWVPASRARRRRRGYDQAEVLARAVARQLRVPAGRFVRRRDSSAQANRSREQRLVGPSILLRRRPPGAVLLIDDVATTGASLAASAAALRAGGAKRVDAAVLAVVG
ncbi:MAG: ComF family protein [Acidimicrobiales bacterium]